MEDFSQTIKDLKSNRSNYPNIKKKNYLFFIDFRSQKKKEKPFYIGMQFLYIFILMII